MSETKIKIEEARFYASLSKFKNARDVVSVIENIQQTMRRDESWWRDDPEEWKEVKRFVGQWFDVICQDI